MASRKTSGKGLKGWIKINLIKEGREWYSRKWGKYEQMHKGDKMYSRELEADWCCRSIKRKASWAGDE